MTSTTTFAVLWYLQSVGFFQRFAWDHCHILNLCSQLYLLVSFSSLWHNFVIALRGCFEEASNFRLTLLLWISKTILLRTVRFLRLPKSQIFSRFSSLAKNVPKSLPFFWSTVPNAKSWYTHCTFTFGLCTVVKKIACNEEKYWMQFNFFLIWCNEILALAICLHFVEYTDGIKNMYICMYSYDLSLVELNIVCC